MKQKNIKKSTRKTLDKTINSSNLKKKDIKKDIGETWNLEPILEGKNFDEWMKIINSDVETFKNYRSVLNDKLKPPQLLEMIRLEEEIAVSVSRLEVYHYLKFYSNTKDPEALAKIGQLKQIDAQISNELIFLNLWFISISDDNAKRFLEAKELSAYKNHLRLIRKAKPYTKSEEIERIMQIKDVTGAGAYANLYQILTNSYSFEWHGKKTSKEEVIAHYHSTYPELREEAYKLILSKYSEDSIMLSEIYKNVVTDWYNEGVKIRGHPTSISIRNHGNDISDKSVEIMLNVVRKNSKIFSEYFRLKHKLNNSAGQKYPNSRYHIYAPLAVGETKKYPYESSKNYVLETFKMFDKRFYDRALRIFNDRHVHSHPAPGKREGAFCYPITKNLTPYLMFNHTDTLRDMFTIAHELGHGVHDILSGEKQVDLERHAALAICETASVFGEMLLAERLLKESKDANEKRYILVQQLDNQFATIIRQSYFVIFEIYAHDLIQKGVTKDVLDKQYYDLLKEQFGDMEIPELFKHEWNYVPHLHETPFYCYAYSWGNLFVLSLYDMYRKEGQAFIDKYVELLSAGGSDSPANVMKKLGANPESEEFWQRGFNIIKLEIEELKKVVG
jgi:oligoendopeptidase F